MGFSLFSEDEIYEIQIYHRIFSLTKSTLFLALPPSLLKKPCVVARMEERGSPPYPWKDQRLFIPKEAHIRPGLAPMVKTVGGQGSKGL